MTLFASYYIPPIHGNEAIFNFMSRFFSAKPIRFFRLKPTRFLPNKGYTRNNYLEQSAGMKKNKVVVMARDLSLVRVFKNINYISEIKSIRSKNK